MTTTIPVILYLSGGLVQNATCPDPEINIDFACVDYDYATFAKDDLRTLAESLRHAARLTGPFDKTAAEEFRKEADSFDPDTPNTNAGA